MIKIFTVDQGDYLMSETHVTGPIRVVRVLNSDGFPAGDWQLEGDDEGGWVIDLDHRIKEARIVL